MVRLDKDAITLFEDHGAANDAQVPLIGPEDYPYIYEIDAYLLDNQYNATTLKSMAIKGYNQVAYDVEVGNTGECNESNDLKNSLATRDSVSYSMIKT